MSVRHVLFATHWQHLCDITAKWVISIETENVAGTVAAMSTNPEGSQKLAGGRAQRDRRIAARRTAPRTRQGSHLGKHLAGPRVPTLLVGDFLHLRIPHGIAARSPRLISGNPAGCGRHTGRT